MFGWQSPEFDNHEQLCCFTEPRSRLKVIVAVHSTVAGPAVGGTRFWPYVEERQALDDALRLSRAMSYKCAVAGVPLGGGKAVILGDPSLLKTRQLLHAYGGFLNRIGTSFSTGEDVGFSVADCETVREISPYIAGTESAGAGDPSVHTARGVFHGLRAVLETKFDRTEFRGLRVAVQGLGSVGWRLAEYLHEAGARLTVADLRAERVELARQRFAAQVVNPVDIHKSDVDIYAPCALGGVINRHTVNDIRARAIAGAANNQLESPELGEVLSRRGVLFAPDFVINAGGVIGAAEELARIPGRHIPVEEPLEIRLEHIYHRLLDIFQRAAREAATPEATAVRMASELLAR